MKWYPKITRSSWFNGTEEVKFEKKKNLEILIILNHKILGHLKIRGPVRLHGLHVPKEAVYLGGFGGIDPSI